MEAIFESKIARQAQVISFLDLLHCQGQKGHFQKSFGWSIFGTTWLAWWKQRTATMSASCRALKQITPMLRQLLLKQSAAAWQHVDYQRTVAKEEK
jgi:hypothetical protein